MMRIGKICVGLAFAILAAITLASGDGGVRRASAAGPTILDIALIGDPAPGAGVGVTFTACTTGSYVGYGFDEPMVNQVGDVLFLACLSNGSWALYLKPNAGSLTPVAMGGTVVAGAGTLPSTNTLDDTDGPALNDAGTAVFAIRRNITAGPATSALFMKTASGSLTTLLKNGDTAPCASCTFIRFDDMSLNNNGDLAFLAVYTNDGGTTAKTGAFLRLADGTLSAIILAGDTLPGTSGKVFTGVLAAATDEVLLDGPWLNDSRTVAFVTDFVFSDPAIALDGSVFAKPYQAAVQPFILIGDPVPAGVGGGTIEAVGLSRPALNNSNVLGFSLGRGTTGGVGTAETFLATKALGGAIDTCVADLSPAPGGGTFNGFSAPSINNDGRLTVSADLAPTVSRGIFFCNAGVSTAGALQVENTKPRGGPWSFEMEESSSGGPFAVFVDEAPASVLTVAAAAAVPVQGVFRITDVPQVPTVTPTATQQLRLKTQTPTMTPSPTRTPSPTATVATSTPIPPTATAIPGGGTAGAIRGPDTGSGGAAAGSNAGLLAGFSAILLAGVAMFGIAVRLRRRA